MLFLVDFDIHIASNVSVYSADMSGSVSRMRIKTKWQTRYKMNKRHYQLLPLYDTKWAAKHDSAEKRILIIYNMFSNSNFSI